MLSQDRTYTRDEFAVMAAEHPDLRLELIDGEIVEKMPTQLHASIAAMIAHTLIGFLQQNPIGYALVEARYGLPDDAHNDRIPEVSFVSKEHGPLVETGPAPYMPDLAVEVQSPGQSDRLMSDKAAYYLANGSRMVWLVYPDRRLVEVLEGRTPSADRGRHAFRRRCTAGFQCGCARFIPATTDRIRGVN